jgi:hypothetical protein
LGGRSFDAAISVNTATHSDHQGKGLFTKLAIETYALAAQRGIQFIVGVANKNSINGFVRKLGFSSLGQVRLYVSHRGFSLNQAMLELDMSPEWLTWRLANPSRQYKLVRNNDCSLTVRTNIKFISFNIARFNSKIIKSHLIAQPNLSLISGASLGLTPFFSINSPGLLRLPLKLQPSEWHVVWRSIDESIDDSFSKFLQFDGLAMDTF